MIKKIAIITGIVLAILLVLAFVLPFVFSDKLKSMAKTELNRQLNAEAGFRDASVSFFRHFPKLSLRLDNLYIAGKDQFKGDTLIAAENLDIAVNLFSLFGSGPVEIRSVAVDHPRIHAIVAKDGKANWDIMKPSESAVADTASTGFKARLDQYSISNGRVVYDDNEGNIHLAIEGLNHEGSGDISAERFTLNTHTTAAGTDFSYANIPYLNKTAVLLDAVLEVSTPDSKFSFSKANAKLNDMELGADGFFQLVNDSTYAMDISFKTPSNDFKSILSLVPAVYQNDFASITTKGKAAFDGFVKGQYSPTQIPAYSLNLKVENGYFKYPDLPQPVDDIQISLKVSNPDGQPDNTVVDLQSANLKFGKEPFSLKALYHHPESIQYLEAAAKGQLDLGTIGQFVKLPAGTKIAGRAAADVQAKGNLAVVLKQQPGPFQANGLIQLNDLSYASAEFPQPISQARAKIVFASPDADPDHTTIAISDGHAQIGSDPIDFAVQLSNLASDPLFDGTVKGAFDLARVKQFYTFEPGTALKGRIAADLQGKGRKSMIDKSNYSAVALGGTVDISDLVYQTKEYPEGLALKSSQLTFNPKEIKVNSAKGSFEQTNFTADGSITNAIGYALKDEPLTGRINVAADKVNLNKWMGTSEASTDTAASKPFEVPANLGLTLNLSADQVSYDKVNYDQVKGSLQIRDQTVALQQLTMQALGGAIGLSGSYSTKVSKTNPDIHFSYDLKNLDVAQTFKAYNTIKYLMPIGEFISGRLNSSMQVNGRLGETMSPVLSSLDGKGMLLLVDGFLSKFKPLEEMAAKLNLPDLKQISVKEVKQYIEFVNGKVLVKPFKVKVNDVDMEIGGMHGFDQSLDYTINLTMPRAKLGTQANQLVNNLAADLGKKGIPVKLGETVSFTVNMGGTLTKPNIQYNLKNATNSLASEMEDKAKLILAEQKAKADSLLAETKKAAKDSLNSLKQQALKDAGQLLKEQLSGKKDSTGQPGVSTPKKAEEAAKGLLNNLLKKRKNPADSTQKTNN